MIPDPKIGKKVEVRRATKGAGLGLFAGENIKSKEYIINYVGEILRNSDCENHTGKYLFEVDDHFTIDGSNRKNIARYINHACKPNSEVEIDSGNIKIYCVKPIEKGEEITYDYGKEYFNEFIKPNGCLCKSCISKKNKSESKIKK